MSDQKSVSKAALWTSYVLHGLVVLMFAFGAINNIMKAEEPTKMAVEMGYEPDSVVYLGVILLVAVIFYAIPKTNILGAILLTGWLGGAVATHIIHSDPLTNTIFPVIFGVLIWFILWLRMPSLRHFIPIVK